MLGRKWDDGVSRSMGPLYKLLEIRLYAFCFGVLLNPEVGVLTETRSSLGCDANPHGIEGSSSRWSRKLAHKY